MAQRGVESQQVWPVILLIENEQDDVFFFRRALSKLCYNCTIRPVGSATEAKMYLENNGQYQDAAYFQRPDLIVSDFKLAGHTALGFVQWLRVTPRFASIPLVMLSGVTSQIDPSAFDGLNVSQFLRKTGDVAALGELLRPILPGAMGFDPGLSTDSDV
jgi:CheY-like chemotaxis protein